MKSAFGEGVESMVVPFVWGRFIRLKRFYYFLSEKDFYVVWRARLSDAGVA